MLSDEDLKKIEELGDYEKEFKIYDIRNAEERLVEIGKILQCHLS